MKSFAKVKRKHRTVNAPKTYVPKAKPQKIIVKRKPICRVVPLIVAQNFDKFIELGNKDTKIRKRSINELANEVRKYLLET